MHIRAATPADHETLVDIWLRSVRATHTFLTEDDIQFFNEHNPAARQFYEAMGFVVTGRSEVDSTGRPFPLLHMREA